MGREEAVLAVARKMKSRRLEIEDNTDFTGLSRDVVEEPEPLELEGA